MFMPMPGPVSFCRGFFNFMSITFLISLLIGGYATAEGMRRRAARNSTGSGTGLGSSTNLGSDPAPVI